ncbi:hypothetical protein SBBP2_700022 [Burkholderiales bacterium]|nr:hypothetical protein SBBP2_700022 [Burkholderiales bacterium]
MAGRADRGWHPRTPRPQPPVSWQRCRGNRPDLTSTGIANSWKVTCLPVFSGCVFCETLTELCYASKRDPNAIAAGACGERHLTERTAPRQRTTKAQLSGG